MSNINTTVLVSNDPTDYEFVIPGAILLDGLMHSFCLGFVLALGLKYWEEYAEDSFRKRAFVLAVVLLSFLQTVLQDYKLWTVAVFHKHWAASPFMWTDFFLNGAICSMCEAFYIRRCWKLTGKSAQFYITITLALEYKYFTLDHILDATVEKLFRDTVVVFSYWVIGCAILDITVAVILITCLMKSKTGLDTSNSVVNRVILLTLETALLPSISMAIAVSVLHGAPNPGHNDDLVLFFVFITAKLYTIGLLRTLNARAKFRERINSTDIGRTSLGAWSWDQDQQKQDAGGRPEFVTSMPDPSTRLRKSTAESSAPTYSSQVHCEGVSPHEVLEKAPGPSGSHHVHFGSPLLDQYERGSYARLRVSSINRSTPQIDEHP
ncbi:hypothetical protein C8R47DRAFT_466640 [Mycena vitilis]|nr:hypothetical protein C8R47DRAFT_466640 [Mycena vitilis]